MKSRPPLFLIVLLLLVFSALSQATGDQAASSDKTSDATPSPAATPLPAASSSANHSTESAKVLVIHKPMPSPSWGKVIQYHRQENFVLLDKNRETLHEFLFQDDAGVVRTAVFHENASGDGYWEVWVWDQP